MAVLYPCPQESWAQPEGSSGQLSHLPGPWGLGSKGSEMPVGYQGQGWREKPEDTVGEALGRREKARG